MLGQCGAASGTHAETELRMAAAEQAKITG